MSKKQREEMGFTLAKLKALEPRDKKKYHVYDAKSENLAVCVTPTGHKSFYVIRRARNGKMTRAFLAKFEPDLPLERVRTMAAEVGLELRYGKDPTADKREARDEPTLGMAFDDWMESWSKTKKKTWEYDEWQFKKYLEHWRHRHLSDIQRSDVVKQFKKWTENNGKTTANRNKTLLNTIFNHAIDALEWNHANPCRKIGTHPKNKRTRWLKEGEVAAFILAVEQEESPWPDVFKLALFTGARKSNVLAMEWNELEDLDGKAPRWRIPASKILKKRGEDAILPLAAESAAILEALKEESNGNPFVFPSKRAKCGHLVEPKEAAKRILDRAKLKDVRIHDLRRTLSSTMANANVTDRIIKAAIGQKTGGQDAIDHYAYADEVTVRKAIQGAVTKFVKAADKKRKGKKS